MQTPPKITARSLAESINRPVLLVMRELQRRGFDIRGPDEELDEEALAAFSGLFTTSNRVFIVHGHDENILQKVENYLYSLDLKAVRLNREASEGKTLIEKLETHGDASFAVVLLTPDDEGRKRTGAPRPPRCVPRARQNVIFEFGYFIARLGRARVCPLYMPGIELPTDLAGLLPIELDDNKERWKLTLRDELSKAGLLGHR